MIRPISTPKCGRTDICISLSDKNLRSLIEAGQPIFLLAETGMEQETVAVAEAVSAKITAGKSMDIDILSDYFFLEARDDGSLVNTTMPRALAGLPPRLLFSSPDKCDLKPPEFSKKPLLINGVDLLSPAEQSCLCGAINSKEILLFDGDKSEKYDMRPILFSLITHYSIYSLSRGRLLDYLKGRVTPQLLARILPGLIELIPLRKAFNYVNSYVDLYLKGLKQYRDTSDRLQNEVYIDKEALEILKTHSWSENYDELRIVLKRCSIFAGNDPVSAADVEAALEGFRMEEESAEPALKYDVPQKFELAKVMKSTEVHLIEQILKNAKTLKEASEILGFNSPQAFDKRIRALGVTIPAHLGRNGSKNSGE